MAAVVACRCGEGTALECWFPARSQTVKLPPALRRALSDPRSVVASRRARSAVERLAVPRVSTRAGNRCVGHRCMDDLAKMSDCTSNGSNNSSSSTSPYCTWSAKQLLVCCRCCHRRRCRATPAQQFSMRAHARSAHANKTDPNGGGKIIITARGLVPDVVGWCGADARRR
jgi:hypothetical protein